MARPLEYKTRVRVPAFDGAPPGERPTKSRALMWGFLAWGASALLGWFIVRGPAPSEWLGRLASEPNVAVAPGVPREPSLRTAEQPRAAELEHRGRAEGHGTQVAPQVGELQVDRERDRPQPGDGHATAMPTATDNEAAGALRPNAVPTPSDEADDDEPTPAPTPRASATSAPSAPSAAPVVASSARPRARLLPGASCEDAVSAYVQELAPGAPRDLSREAYAKVLEHGAWFSHCAVPEQVAVDVCVAVQHGRPVGVSVSTTPATRHSSRCVSAAAWALRFPVDARLDVTRTHFSAAP